MNVQPPAPSAVVLLLNLRQCIVGRTARSILYPHAALPLVLVLLLMVTNEHVCCLKCNPREWQCSCCEHASHQAAAAFGPGLVQGRCLVLQVLWLLHAVWTL